MKSTSLLHVVGYMLDACLGASIERVNLEGLREGSEDLAPKLQARKTHRKSDTLNIKS